MNVSAVYASVLASLESCFSRTPVEAENYEALCTRLLLNEEYHADERFVAFALSVVEVVVKHCKPLPARGRVFAAPLPYSPLLPCLLPHLDFLLARSPSLFSIAYPTPMPAYPVPSSAAKPTPVSLAVIKELLVTHAVEHALTVHSSALASTPANAAIYKAALTADTATYERLRTGDIIWRASLRHAWLSCCLIQGDLTEAQEDSRKRGRY